MNEIEPLVEQPVVVEQPSIVERTLSRELPLVGEEPEVETLPLAGSRILVGVIMGSTSDWDTMRHATEMLEQFDIPYEKKVVSAHRTPARMAEYATTAETRGLEVIIAGAGGAAHLPGMVAAQTAVPVLGVPVQSRTLNGLDSLLSIVQMPGGVPVGTLAIGRSGAKNAALLAIAILGNKYPQYREALNAFRQAQTDKVLGDELPPKG